MRKKTEVCIKCSINRPNKGKICEKCRYIKRKEYFLAWNKKYQQEHKAEIGKKRQYKRNRAKKNIDPEVVWMAGFIDGEGCFMIRHGTRRISKYSDKRTGTRMIEFLITNTAYKTIAHISEILTRYGIGHHLWERKYNEGSKNLNNMHLIISGMKRMELILNLVEPYLYTKKKETEILRSYISLRKDYGLFKPYVGERELELIQQLKDQKRIQGR